MRVWTKWLFALAAPLTLTGCLWDSGQVHSPIWRFARDGTLHARL